MCLEVEFHQSAKVAEEDIICYKFLRILKDGSLFAPYYNTHEYVIGEEYTSNLSIHHNTTSYMDPYSVIREGLHSVASLYYAQWFAQYREKLFCGHHKYVVVECVIPKGATYYEGTWDGTAGYASSWLKVTKVIESLVSEEK